METYDTVPKSKDILAQLDDLQEKKNTLMQDHSKTNDLFYELVQHKKNYKNYKKTFSLVKLATQLLLISR